MFTKIAIVWGPQIETSDVGFNSTYRNIRRWGSEVRQICLYVFHRLMVDQSSWMLFSNSFNFGGTTYSFCHSKISSDDIPFKCPFRRDFTEAHTMFEYPRGYRSSFASAYSHSISLQHCSSWSNPNFFNGQISRNCFFPLCLNLKSQFLMVTSQLYNERVSVPLKLCDFP